MKRMLNTLYVMTEGSYLARERETVVVRQEKKSVAQVPIHGLDGIVCFGRIGCSPHLMGLCAERNVAISFFSRTGRYWARVQGPVSGNVLLRREQYRRAAEPDGSAEIARAVVTAKVANCRTVLMRALRDHPETPGAPALREGVTHLARVLKSVADEQSLDSVRGYEGEAARAYFQAFDHLVVAQKDEFGLKGRSRRPPLDNMNALLSFLYSVLAHDVASALEGVGLDPAVGFLHRDRPGRPGLALDLMEELRPVFADRLALSLVNRQQVGPGGFSKSESGAVMMTDDTRRGVLKAYQERKADEMLHPYLNEKAPLGLIPHLQAMLMARHLRGDLDGYPAFIWR